MLEEAATCIVQLVAIEWKEAALQSGGQIFNRAFLPMPSEVLMLLSKKGTWRNPAHSIDSSF